MRKVDLCLSSEGTEVILATSSDEKHPPENMIDGNPETFWTTTGMFPQEFIICFHKHVRIEKLVIQSYFELLNHLYLFFPLQACDGHVTYLRFIIVSAFDHFASVHSVSAEGMAVSN
ncbi:hypothetical protein MJG53_020385, partial [Ovis ammon polii x Ovis aries]